MDQNEFEAELRRDGYQIVYNGFPPGAVNAEHAHDWDARLLILGGEITITRGGKSEGFRAGDTCAVTAGEKHTEHVGAQGVAYIAGPRSAR